MESLSTAQVMVVDGSALRNQKNCKEILSVLDSFDTFVIQLQQSCEFVKRAYPKIKSFAAIWKTVVSEWNYPLRNLEAEKEVHQKDTKYNCIYYQLMKQLKNEVQIYLGIIPLAFFSYSTRHCSIAYSAHP